MVCTPEPIISAYQLAGQPIPVQRADREPGHSPYRIPEPCRTVPRCVFEPSSLSLRGALEEIEMLFPTLKNVIMYMREHSINWIQCFLQILYADVKVHHNLNSLTYRYDRWGEKKSLISTYWPIYTHLWLWSHKCQNNGDNNINFTATEVLEIFYNNAYSAL